MKIQQFPPTVNAPLPPVPQSKKANIIIGAITDSLHFHETKRMAAALHVRSPRSPAQIYSRECTRRGACVYERGE